MRIINEMYFWVFYYIVTLGCLIEGGLNSRGGGEFFSKSNKRVGGGGGGGG